MDGGESLHPGQGPFQLADVPLDLVGDEAKHLFWNESTVVTQLRVQDRKTCLEVRRLDVGDKAPLEPRPEAVLERGNLLGRPVG